MVYCCTSKVADGSGQWQSQDLAAARLSHEISLGNFLEKSITHNVQVTVTVRETHPSKCPTPWYPSFYPPFKIQGSGNWEIPGRFGLQVFPGLPLKSQTWHTLKSQHIKYQHIIRFTRSRSAFYMWHLERFVFVTYSFITYYRIHPFQVLPWECTPGTPQNNNRLITNLLEN